VPVIVAVTFANDERRATVVAVSGAGCCPRPSSVEIVVGRS